MFGNVALFLLLSITISYAQDCADDVDFCHSIVDNKQCSLGAAKRHCRKSCGHCSEPKPPQPTPSPDCKDDRDDCENAFYICGEYPQFAAQCKQTCEICGQPERPPPTPGSGCEDEVRFCHSVVDHGICGLNAAKRLCRKSCGHCEAPVPALPTPTDGCKDDRDDCEGAFYVCGEYPESAAMCKMTCQLCGEVTALTNKPLEKTTMMPGEISTTRAQEIRTTEGRQSTTMKIEQTTTMKIKEPTTPTTARGLDCPTTQMKREYRETVLKSHNDYRSTVAMGTAQMLGGSYAKRAKNMYKLIYDCDLERQSQEWANRCKYGHSPDDLRNAGENIWATYASYPLTIDQQSMLGATKYWWNELMKYGIIDQSYKYSNAMFSIGHWTQMAWGNTTRVGCGVADCPGMLGTYTTYVVCQYRAPGNYRGRQIYDFGDGCSRDSDCTLFSGSKCEAQTGLCLTPGGN